MNKYGVLLLSQWREANPRFVESLDDPRAHFAQLGEQVQSEVTALLPSMEGSDPAGETYLEKVGRLQAARLQAEEAVLAEYQPTSDSPEPVRPEGWEAMSHDAQETWIRSNLPEGTEQDDELQSLEDRRINRMLAMGASVDEADYQQD